MNRDDVSKLTERIFDVMEQIRSGKQNISDSTFTRFNEDLLNLYYSLTDNPSDVPTTFIGVLDSVKTNNNKNAGYNTIFDFITLSSELVQDVKSGKKSLAEYMYVLGHENSHSERNRADIVDDYPLDEYASDAAKKLYSVDDELLASVNNYFEKHVTPELRKIVGSKSQDEIAKDFRKQAFAGYARKKSERQAQKDGENFCTTILEYLIQEPNCTSDMRRYIDGLIGKVNNLSHDESNVDVDDFDCENMFVDRFETVRVEDLRKLEDKIKELREKNPDDVIEIENIENRIYSVMPSAVWETLKDTPIDEIVGMYAYNINNDYEMTSITLNSVLQQNMTKEQIQEFSSKLSNYLVKDVRNPSKSIFMEIELLSDEQKINLAEEYLNQDKVMYVVDLLPEVSHTVAISDGSKRQQHIDCFEKILDNIISYGEDIVSRIENDEHVLEVNSTAVRAILTNIVENNIYDLSSEQRAKIARIDEIIENYNAKNIEKNKGNIKSEEDYKLIEQMYGKAFADMIREADKKDINILNFDVSKDNSPKQNSILDIKLDDDEKDSDISILNLFDDDENLLD